MKLNIGKLKLNSIRFLAWLVFIGLIAAIYITSGSRCILIIALCIIIMPLCMLLSNLIAGNHIGIAMCVQTSCERGEYCDCEVELINSSIMPVLRAQLEIEAENGLTAERKTLKRISFVPACGKSTLKFRFKSLHCGQIAMSASQLYLADCFGIIGVAVHFNADVDAYTNASVKPPININDNMSVNAVQRIAVLPETCEIPAISSSSALMTVDSDSYAEGIRGDDYSEVLLLREYAPGDSLKQIHWKLSGKLDRLIVREPSMPAQRSLLICMDISLDCTPDESDAIAEITASVLRAFSDAGSIFSIARPEENGCGFMEIEKASELTRAVEWLMGCSRCDDAYLVYAEHNGAVGYTRIIWCGKRFDEGARAFCGNAEIVPLLCSSDGDVNLSPKNYREGLMHLEL